MREIRLPRPDIADEIAWRGMCELAPEYWRRCAPILRALLARLAGFDSWSIYGSFDWDGFPEQVKRDLVLAMLYTLEFAKVGSAITCERSGIILPAPPPHGLKL